MNGIESTTPREADERRSSDVVLLDCREPFELDLARIDGAIHIPMGDLQERLGELDPGQEIIVFCHHGIRSYAVVGYLVRQGFRRACNLEGGIDAWSLEVDPGVPRY